MSLDVQIVYPSASLFPSFHRALDQVAREKIYLEMIEAPSFEKVSEFQTELIGKGGPVYYALAKGEVVGWCDIFPNNNPRLGHRGGLGMGIVKEYRGQGVGKRLILACLDHAKEFGLEKVELSVYTTNTSAIALYRSVGFVEEGLIKKYRKLDGQYQDCILMAKTF